MNKIIYSMEETMKDYRITNITEVIITIIIVVLLAMTVATFYVNYIKQLMVVWHF